MQLFGFIKATLCIIRATIRWWCTEVMEKTNTRTLHYSGFLM